MDRHEDLDWVRTASAVSVVLLHVSSVFVARDSRLTFLGVSPALLCNQITRFAVPVFFLLSGLGLGLSNRPLKLPGFWLHRLRKIAIPYVLWTLFYLVLEKRSELAGMPLLPALGNVGRSLLTGNAESHLWFLPALVQLYLLYPGLKWLMRRAPWWTLAASFLVSGYCTLAVYVPLPVHGWLWARIWRLFPTWLFYFVLGMALTEERLEKLRLFLRKYAPLLILAGLVLALVYAWDSRRCGNLDSIKPQLFIYAPVCFLALMASWNLLKRSRTLAAFSAFTARHAMTVYFAHIFFLQLLRRIPFMNRNLLTMLLTFLLTLALCLLTALAPEAYTRWRKKRKTA